MQTVQSRVARVVVVVLASLALCDRALAAPSPPPPPPPGDLSTGDAGTWRELETPTLLGEALSLLQRKFELLPLVHPDNEGTDGFAELRSEFRQTERDLATILIVLQDRGIEVGDDVASTMALPISASDQNDPVAPPRPPPADVFIAAIAALDALVAEHAGLVDDAGGPVGVSSDVASQPGDGVPLVALLALGILTAVVGGTLIAQGRRRRRRREAELVSAHDEAVKDSLTDPLTGLANRRRLDVDIDGLGRSGVDAVAVMMVDIDNFKSFNDRYGHQVGDEVLGQVADVLRSAVRENDVVYRYGGEEFCILLAATETAGAAEIAERVHAALAADARTSAFGLTVSIGVSAGGGVDVDDTITSADGALYDAKRAGRNRTVLVG